MSGSRLRATQIPCRGAAHEIGHYIANCNGTGDNRAQGEHGVFNVQAHSLNLGYLDQRDGARILALEAIGFYSGIADHFTLSVYRPDADLSVVSDLTGFDRGEAHD